jgi:hypothetical protein
VLHFECPDIFSSKVFNNKYQKTTYNINQGKSRKIFGYSGGYGNNLETLKGGPPKLSTCGLGGPSPFSCCDHKYLIQTPIKELVLSSKLKTSSLYIVGSIFC